ncbi:OLC1v1000448C1 [Oldenlandia corymbosa var. corymbosa]|uniref:OLC1v1000448C1 n=1 Tax=Oldenlandia corymbosa var. corymbosa TaxID=529605 RepID=A0AAV1D4D9_OLDCO|nr:OLC1v1000448C1 [Oldenlandia corymbosa var. corymbosa]
MAIITEEPDSPKSSTKISPPKPHSTSSPSPSSSSSSGANPFQFWFYFTLSVSLITLFFVSLPSFTTQDPKKWFLTLPPNLRQHYSKGRIFKVQITPNLPQVEAFSIQDGPVKSDHKVLIVHGFGCSSYAFRGIVKALGLKGVHAIAIDLPGSGFSDKSMTVMEENVGGGGGGLSELWEVYNEIKEKGLFSGFDQLIEKGYIDHEEKKLRVSKREVVKSIELGTEEMGRVLSQVINDMGLAPVDLVLHDSALGLSANWISENSKLVRSVILLDSLPYRTALPLWAVGVPVLREVILGFGFVFERVLEKFCLKSVTKSEADAYRVLLKGRDGGRSAVEMGKRVNYSLDLSEWARLDEVKGLPMRVIWSSSFLEWSQEGSWVGNAVRQATFVSHSGGPWVQEGSVSEEIAESIYEFVSSLPKATRQAEEEATPEHIKMVQDESKSSDHHQHVHGSHNHHDGHAHTHAHAGYADAYGLGDGWTIDFESTISPMNSNFSALLCQDTLRAILEKLPLPDLARSACVCRLWSYVASDREMQTRAFKSPWKIKDVIGDPSSGSFWRDNGISKFAISHRICRGDSVVGLAVKYSVQVMDIKRLNNMMSDHGIYSRERLLIPISKPEILKNGTCYIELDPYAKREVAVLYLEGRPDKKLLNVSNRWVSEQAKKKVLESLRRSMQVDDGTAQYYLSISDGDPRAALTQFSEDLRWERQVGFT